MPELLEATAPNGRFRLCDRAPGGGGPGGGPGRGIPGCQFGSGDARVDTAADDVAAELPDCMWPVDAARLAAGGLASSQEGVCTELLACGTYGSRLTGCFPRRPDRLKNDLFPPSPDVDRSRYRDDWPGGGGNAGDIGICGELLDELSAIGEAVKPLLSSIVDAEVVAALAAWSGVAGE